MGTQYPCAGNPTPILPGDVGLTFGSMGTHRGVTCTCGFVPVLSLLGCTCY